jgi:hypothetical protein
MKAGLDALASAAAGSPQAHVKRPDAASSEAGSAAAEAAVTPTSNHSTMAGINLSNLSPHQQQQIMQLIQNQNSAANNHAAANQVSNANATQAAALLGGLQQMTQNQSPMFTLQGLQQQIASHQLLQLLMNRQQQQNGGNTPAQAHPIATTNGGNYLDSQPAQKLHALLGSMQTQSKQGMLL